MFTKEEIKEFIVKYGKKWFFPDFSNKITWHVVTLGAGVIIAPTPFKLIFYNWLIDTFNLNSGKHFIFSEISSNSADYWLGFVLIFIALAHNFFSKWITLQESVSVKELAKKSNEADKKLFDKFLEELPSNSASIKLLKEHDFGNSFFGDHTNEIENFVNKWNVSELQFLDSELEEKKMDLWQNCHKFLLKLAESSGPIGNGPRFSVIPDHCRGDWDLPEFVNERVRELNKNATICHNLHQEMVALCKQKLKC